MSAGAYVNKPDRRIRHLHDILTCGPRTFDAVVVGGGVVGLAACRALALEGQHVILLEAEKAVGTHTSSRNSEVIHSGIYYTPGSLKAKLCIDGRHRLYEYCDSHHVPYNKLGKLLVAVHDDQITKLKGFLENGKKNGMTDLEWLDGPAAKELEPDLNCVAALWSPSTGVISSQKLMESYRKDAEQHGAVVAFNCEVVGGQISGRLKTLQVKDRETGQTSTVHAHMVVNAAGLYAQSVACSLQGLPRQTIPEAFLARGHYCTMEGKPPFKRLIYPMPESWGLGVHLTLDLEGRARFGPDVEWIDKVEYKTSPEICDKFYPVIRQYWPGLPDGRLRPSYSGIRPKVVGPGKPGKDFVIQGPKDHGVKGLVNLYGIESPGLTSSLSIGELVMQMLLHNKEAPGSVSGGEQRD
ncbi:hypothetical protein ABBQ38_000651 [Trebouxia sp. C0009 RCD-2024]